ncbi:MAG: tRNA pseudouridine(55) synthase TruB [Deltaproteobacteria bacterium]|nr:MAG: tRNA pseudouridine(55) synthase TruB [Deltaproteobacteria bacterium]
MRNQISGVVNLYKEKGYTSFAATEKVKRLFRARKAGHGGTLDPEAEGVLPILLGKATKISTLFLNADKSYRMKILFGVETDTHDLTGQVLRRVEDFHLDEERVREALEKFVGTYEQVPPRFSAVKVDGKRAYDLARKGIDFDLPAKVVTCHEATLVSFDGKEAEVFVRCKAGFYLRAMVRDLGEAVGVPAVASHIRREEAGFMTVDTSLKISELSEMKREGRLEEAVRSIDEALSHYPSIRVPDFVKKRVLVGCPPEEYMPLSPPEGIYKIKDEEENVIALVKRTGEGRFEYVCVLGES